MNLALIGTGLLGFSAATRILEKGLNLVVYNRSLQKALPLETKGAKIARSLSEVFDLSDCILLFLSDKKAIDAVLDAISSDSIKGKTIIQMGTIAVKENEELNERVKASGGSYVEAPVLGSRNEAKNGTLILMAGATKDQFEQYLDLFRIFSQNPKYIGEVGKASAMKLALNLLIASHAVSFSSSLGIIRKNGIDVDIFSDILKESSLYAPMYDKKLSKWLSGDYENPNFPVRHLLKDVLLISQELTEKNISAKTMNVLNKLLLESIDKGFGDEDYSAIYKAINNE